MIEILRIRVQILNGTNCIKTIRMKSISIFDSMAQVEQHRAEMEQRLQKKHEGHTVAVLFDLRRKEGE